MISYNFKKKLILQKLCFFQLKINSTNFSLLIQSESTVIVILSFSVI